MSDKQAKRQADISDAGDIVGDGSRSQVVKAESGGIVQGVRWMSAARLPALFPKPEVGAVRSAYAALADDHRSTSPAPRTPFTLANGAAWHIYHPTRPPLHAAGSVTCHHPVTRIP